MKFPVSWSRSSLLGLGGGRRTCRWVVAGLVAAFLPEAAAHDLFTAYVQHRVQVVVDARYVDLTVDLTFFEEWSARERRTMDANTNGVITRAEVQHYLQDLAPRVAQQVRLRVAGQEAPLIPLHEPEVDLLGNDRAGPGHHRLRLSLFAAMPSGLRVGDAIVVEDGLWPAARSLATVQADGRDGCRFELRVATDRGLTASPPGKAQTFELECRQPPAAAAPTAAQSHPTAQAVPSPP